MSIRSAKIQLVILLVSLAGYMAIADRDYLFLLGTCIALAATVITDSLFLYGKSKKIVVTESSLVSGLIVGFVLSPVTGLWIPAFAGVATIVSKHALRWRNRHVFNPAGFGVFVSILLFGWWLDTGTQWNGAYMWYVLAPAGIYLAYRVRKIELVVSYYVVYLCSFGAQAMLQEMPVVSVVMYANYFFILVMLIEPKTSPSTRLGKIIYGASAAVIVFVLYSVGFKYDANLVALLTCNIATPFLNKLHVGNMLTKQNVHPEKKSTKLTENENNHSKATAILFHGGTAGSRCNPRVSCGECP